MRQKNQQAFHFFSEYTILKKKQNEKRSQEKQN